MDDIKIVAKPGMLVSKDTLRTDTLVVNFMTALREIIGNHRYGEFLREQAYYIHWIINPTYGNFVSPDSKIWQTNDIYYFLNRILTSKMSSLAPEGYYFGSKPDCLSDIGYWPRDLKISPEPGDKDYIPSREVLNIWATLRSKASLAVITEMIRQDVMASDVEIETKTSSEMETSLGAVRSVLKTHGM